MIDHLEQKNLVERSRVSHDRRVVTISLTEVGKNLAERAASDMNQAFTMVLCHLNGNEVEQIVRAMNGLKDLIHIQNLKNQNATHLTHN
jgi:DNA-binding MarR family transcriptional regulator